MKGSLPGARRTRESSLLPQRASLGRVNLRDDCFAGGDNDSMNEWQELAECLVELDLTIEDLESWATAPEDIAELQRNETLRDEIQLALRLHHIPRSLKLQLGDHRLLGALRATTIDPRDYQRYA